jgi:hypothetical protein
MGWADRRGHYSDDEVPENVSFVQDDVTKGLPYPDGSIDIVHARLLVAGVSPPTILHPHAS